MHQTVNLTSPTSVVRIHLLPPQKALRLMSQRFLFVGRWVRITNHSSPAAARRTHGAAGVVIHHLPLFSISRALVKTSSRLNAKFKFYKFISNFLRHSRSSSNKFFAMEIALSLSSISKGFTLFFPNFLSHNSCNLFH